MSGLEEGERVVDVEVKRSNQRIGRAAKARLRFRFRGLCILGRRPWRGLF